VGPVGGLAEAIGLSTLTALLSASMEPETFGVGEFAMAFACTVPVGMVLGVPRFWRRTSRRRHWIWTGGIAALGGASALAFATAVA
jgi:hypothetical protein